MPALLLAAAASFACLSPSHHDGDNIRCANVTGSMRLEGIDAPEMPGACRPGRACTPGDPYAARDQLRALTRGRDVVCRQDDTDTYGRRVVRCTADGQDLSCAMIASGHAVPRYAGLDCGGGTVTSGDVGKWVSPEPQANQGGDRRKVTPGREWTSLSPPSRPLPKAAPPPRLYQPSRTPPWLWPAVLGWLALINLWTWISFYTDKQLAIDSMYRRVRRTPERTLLTLAAIGGSPAAWGAMHWLRHKNRKDSFVRSMILITGLQVGAIIGIILW